MEPSTIGTIAVGGAEFGAYFTMDSALGIPTESRARAVNSGPAAMNGDQICVSLLSAMEVPRGIRGG